MASFAQAIKNIIWRVKPKMSQAEFWDRRYNTDEFVYTLTPNMFVIEFLGDLKPGKVIDVAGGEGRNSLYLAEKGWTAENVDVSLVGLNKWLKIAEERGVKDRALANLSSGTDFKAKLAPADLGMIAYLQAEKKIIDASIANTAKQLKPGGMLFGVWHCRENLKDGYGGPQDPKVLPTAAELRETCEKLGLDVKVCENRDGLVQTKEGYKPSLVVVLQAYTPAR
ncbi:MAG: class I SAM-dependent methyltransferase [Micrococcales bacterium]